MKACGLNPPLQEREYPRPNPESDKSGELEKLLDKADDDTSTSIPGNLIRYETSAK